jgi:hypothetical protein
MWLRIWTIAAGALFATASLAWGSLGGDSNSVQADQIQMQGTRRMIAAPTHTIHEIQAASGTVVREYVSSDGKVFAVTFHGPWIPDLQQLLGTHFEHYSRAIKAQSDANVRRARHPVMVDEPGLTVQIGGHPRAFAGRAYIPELLPAGIRVEDIR